MADYGAGYAKGRAQGLLAAAGRKRQAATRMAEIGLAQQRINMARKDQEIRVRDAQRRDAQAAKREGIDAGLAQAVGQGGYESGIEYLKRVDPDRAMGFEKEKLNLDKSILGNDRLKTLGESEKQKALFEAYGRAGKLSAGIASIQDPKERQRAYKVSKPIFDAVAPGAMPEKYGPEAEVRMGLFQSLGTPENILSTTAKNSALLKTDIGKISMALEERLRKGHTVENDTVSADLSNRLNTLRLKDRKAQAEYTKLQAETNANRMRMSRDERAQRNSQMKADKDMFQRYREETQPAREFLDNYMNFNAAYKAWDSGRGGAAAETAMVRLLGMMFNKGQLSDSDAAAFATSDSGIQVLLRRIRSTYEDSGAIVANPTELARLKALIDSMQEERTEHVLDANHRYKKMISDYRITPEAVPLVDMDQYITQESYSPEQLNQMAQEAIEAGADPEAVKQRMQELQSGR